MIDHATLIDPVSVRRGLLGTLFAATLATAAFYLSETNLIIVLACIVGAISGLWPIVMKARKSPPNDVDTLMTLSRAPTRSFVLWLVMMAVYLFAGRPLGLPLFEFITGWCLAGLFFTRLAFPALTLLLWAFNHETRHASIDESGRSLKRRV